MRDALSALLPLFAFMLIPIWIPLVSAAAGRLYAAVAGDR